MPRDLPDALVCEVLDDEQELSLDELCRICDVNARRVRRLIEHGVLAPRGSEPARWRFRAVHLRRVRCALRLRRDLGVNWAGAALALELLEELRVLRERTRRPGDPPRNL